MNTLASMFETMREMSAFDRLGGSESKMGRRFLFELLLKEAHKENEQEFRGMECYGNVPDYNSVSTAIAEFLSHEYTEEDLKELQKDYAESDSPDCIALGAYINFYFRTKKERI